MNRSRIKKKQFAPGEALESRIALSGDGVLWGSDARLTLSFAPDGTQVDGQRSELFSTFDSVAPRDAWQSAILEGFQNWAKHTNGDIGLVNDNGSPFGAAGATHHDPRFGDVRVGSVPLDEALFAISISFDETIDGTWAGELLFNSDAQIDSLADILAISAHEAGNIMGLEDSTDPLSPLFDGAIPTITEPTAADVNNLQALHGPRAGDIFALEDFDVGNLGFIEFRSFETIDDVDGGAPSIAFGDISAMGEVDIFEHEIEQDYDGSFTVEVITAGISQLAPDLVLKDQNGNLLNAGSQTTSASAGENVQIHLDPAADVTSIVLEVGSATTDSNAIGGYTLKLTYDGLNQIGESSIASLVNYPLRLVELDDLREYFEDGQQLFANDDDGNDDFPGGEGALNTTPGFAEGSRYQMLASVEAIGDVDRYLVMAPDELAPGFESGAINLQSIEVGQFSGRITVLDADGSPINADVLVHNSNQMIIQIPVVAPNQLFTLEVAADLESPNSIGNYELVARFGTAPIARDLFVQGRLRTPSRVRHNTLDVDRSQLFHFILQAESSSPLNDSMIEMTIRNSASKVVLQLETRVGDTRSATILLGAGHYEITTRTSHASNNWAPISYSLRGAAVDDPLGPRLHDSLGDPYEFADETRKLFIATFFPF